MADIEIQNGSSHNTAKQELTLIHMTQDMRSKHDMECHNVGVNAESGTNN
jgi:hypothetical protein